jgi:hypothetical protein
MKKGKRLMEHSSTRSLSLVVYLPCSTPHLIHHGNDNDRMVSYSESITCIFNSDHGNHALSISYHSLMIFHPTNMLSNYGP